MLLHRVGSKVKPALVFYDRFRNVIEVNETYGGDIGGMSNLWASEEEYMALPDVEKEKE